MSDVIVGIVNDVEESVEMVSEPPVELLEELEEEMLVVVPRTVIVDPMAAWKDSKDMGEDCSFLLITDKYELIKRHVQLMLDDVKNVSKEEVESFIYQWHGNLLDKLNRILKGPSKKSSILLGNRLHLDLGFMIWNNGSQHSFKINGCVITI